MDQVQGATDTAAATKWTDVKHVIDRAQSHVCDHSSYRDMQLLPSRNGFCSDGAGKYLTEMITRCGPCQATAKPHTSRTVSLSSLFREFKELVCVENCFIEGILVFHAMDAGCRYSAVAICNDTTMRASLCALHSAWFGAFCPRGAIQGDQALNNDAFKNYLPQHNLKFRPSPSRVPTQNVLVSKHGFIRSL